MGKFRFKKASLAKDENRFVMGGPNIVFKTNFNSAQVLHAIKVADEKKKQELEKEEENKKKKKSEKTIKTEKEQLADAERASKAWSVYQQTGLKPIVEDSQAKESEEKPKKVSKKVTEKKVGSSFAKFLAGETDEELKNSSDVQAFLIEGKDLETSINSLLLNQIRNGMTDEQFFNVVMNSSRDNSVGITATIKKNDGKYPDGLHLSKYSSKISKQKEEFSLKTLKAFAAGKRDNMRKTDFVREGAAHGLYTEIQAQNIVSERDLYRILLKPGIEPETVSENQRRLNLFVGKNLDSWVKVHMCAKICIFAHEKALFDN